MNWNDVKYGIADNKAAIENASNAFFNHGAIIATNTEHYTNVIKAIRENWSGPDADAFINNFEKKIGSMRTNLESKYRTEFETIVANELANYKAAQAKNAQTMKF